MECYLDGRSYQSETNAGFFMAAPLDEEMDRYDFAFALAAHYFYPVDREKELNIVQLTGVFGDDHIRYRNPEDCTEEYFGGLFKGAVRTTGAR